LVGCAGQSDNPPRSTQEDETKAARSKVELGPVRVTVEVEPAHARLSDEPTLTLSIDHQQGVKLDKPPFGEAMGDFIIRDFREPLPKVRGDRRIVRQIYTLEPTRTGKLSIFPISVTFTDNRAEGDGKKHTIRTEGLTVEIASVLDSEVPSLDELRPASGPVELPAAGNSAAWWLLSVAGTLLVAAAAVAWWLWRRGRKPSKEEPLSPRELAYLELARLVEEDLASRDVKLFYVELTAVVRRYIERTTGVHAPEQTTEEFLRQISRQATFSHDEGLRLKDFLEAADLVKFAAHQPAAEDVEESFRRAKVFIGVERLEVAA